MKCEADVVSGHVSRFETPFLRKIFKFPNLPLQSVSLFPCSYSILLLLLSHLIFDLSAARFLFCPRLHLSFSFLAAHMLGRLAHLLALPWTACAIQKHSISSLLFHHKPLLIWLMFTNTFTNLYTLLDVYPLLQILVTRLSAKRIPRTRTTLLLGNERLICSVVHINASWNMSKCAWVREFGN